MCEGRGPVDSDARLERTIQSGGDVVLHFGQLRPEDRNPHFTGPDPNVQFQTTGLGEVHFDDRVSNAQRNEPKRGARRFDQ